MSTVNIFQISLEIWGCIICVLVTMLSGEKAYKEGGALARIWFMLVANGMLLASDALAYIFNGDMSALGIAMTRISNFLVFALEGVMTWNMAACVHSLISEGKKKIFEERWMRLCSVFVLIQLLGTAVTPFTNFYYYLDVTNHYHRSLGVALSFVMLGSVCLVSAVELYLRRSKVPTGILHALRTAVPIFFVCFVIQFLEYGISLINVGLTILLLLLYMVLWNDSTRRQSELRMNEVEEIMRALMEERNRQD